MADITPPNYTTDVGKVRLLCTDVTEPYIFSDEQITAFLDVTGGNVKRAAALALDVIASDEVLLTKVIRTDDLSVDGAKVADALRKNAQALRDQANADDAAGLDESFLVTYPAEYGVYPEGVAVPVYGRVVGVEQWR